METITRIILLGLLASAAYLAYRLDSQATAHAEAMAAVQAEREANLAQLQTLERQRAERINEIEVAAQGKLEKVNCDAANARRAADGLRGQLADFAKRGESADSTTLPASAKQSNPGLTCSPNCLANLTQWRESTREKLTNHGSVGLRAK